MEQTIAKRNSTFAKTYIQVKKSNRGTALEKSAEESTGGDEDTYLVVLARPRLPL